LSLERRERDENKQREGGGYILYIYAMSGGLTRIHLNVYFGFI
jgi:hypothetical protein